MFDQLELMQRDLIAANQKLFQAGKLAGKQQTTIDQLGETISQALLFLEKAHQAAHLSDRQGCLAWMAQAMEILANDS